MFKYQYTLIDGFGFLVFLKWFLNDLKSKQKFELNWNSSTEANWKNTTLNNWSNNRIDSFVLGLKILKRLPQKCKQQNAV